ncbi:MAG: cation:proton antiporter, partial [Eubacteriales bacterium]|nr:cation:proton antiporter [Eubacteriales bacterium]
MFISDLLSRAPSYACLTISAALMLAAAFLVSRLTRLLRLPDVTGYLLAGIALGPYALRVIPAGVIEDLGFLTDIALACIAFGVGRYFTLARLRTTGSGVIWLTLTESLAAAVLIALSMRG